MPLKLPPRAFQAAAVLFTGSAAAAAATLGFAAWLAGWWIDYSQPPRRADMAVVLAGGFSRPMEGAELYHGGLVPEIWISRVFIGPAERMALERGVPIPREENLNREILLKWGVPASAVRVYGNGVMSTAEEAMAFRAEAKPSGKTVLLVTSRWHLRRAAWVFRTEIPDAEIVAVAARGEPFTRKWWTVQFLARNTILEGCKTLYYLFGGRFLANLEHTPHVP